MKKILAIFVSMLYNKIQKAGQAIQNGLNAHSIKQIYILRRRLKKMTKGDLINAMMDRVQNGDVKNKTAMSRVIDAFCESVTAEVANGGDVTLIGFGTFKKVEKAARAGKNPRTGEKIQIAAKSAPKFVPGKSFKDAVNAK